MEHGLARAVAVRLVRQHDVARGSPVALQRLEEPLRLDGEGPAVVVRLAVEEQDRLVDPVRVGEGRDPQVELGRVPERPPLALEPEGREGAVVGPAAGDAGGEEVGVGQEVGGHEGPVAVAAHDHAAAVHHSFRVEHVDRGLGRRRDLLDVGVVHRLRVAHHRHGRVHEHGVALGQEGERRGAGHARERVRGAAHLPGGRGVRVLERVGPHQGGPARPRGVSRGQVERAREGHPVLAGVLDELPRDAGELGGRVAVVGELPPATLGEVHDVEVRRIGLRLRADEHLRPRGPREGEEVLGPPLGAAEEPVLPERRKRQAVEERTVARLGRAVAREVDRVRVLEGDALTARPRLHHGVSGVAVGVVDREVEEDPGGGGCGEVHEGRGAPAAVPISFRDQGDARTGGPVERGEALPEPRHLGGGGDEGGAESHHALAVRDFPPRVAAVEGLDPDDRRRHERLPGDPARPGRDALPGHLVRHREVGDRGQLPARRVPDLGRTGEGEERHPHRKGRLHPLDQEIPPVGRGQGVGVEPRFPERRGRPRRAVHDRELRARVVLEERRVLRGAEEVLEGGHLRGLARGLLDHGADRHRLGAGCFAAGRRDGAREQGPAPRPGERRAEHVVETEALDRAGGPGRGVAHPELDPVREVARESETPAVGGERGPAGPRARGERYAEGSAALDRLDLEAGEAERRLAAAGGRADADAAEAQDGLGEERDRRVGLGLGEKDGVGGRADHDLGRRRGVDERHDFLRRQLVGRLGRGRQRGQGQEDREQEPGRAGAPHPRSASRVTTRAT